MSLAGARGGGPEVTPERPPPLIPPHKGEGKIAYRLIRSRSLALRLILSSAAVSIVLLVAAGFLLAGLFQSALERNFDSRLQAVLDGLLANVELGRDGAPGMQGQIADTRFSLPLSGWYWQVMPPPGSSVKGLTSGSLLEQRLVPDSRLLSKRDADGTASFYLTGDNGVQLRAIEQGFKLPGSDAQYSFLVAGNFDELKQEAGAFRWALISVLTLLGSGLLAAILIQVRFGLRPLRRMQQNLTAIREGQAERLEGEFPSEIQPVADELNLLIKSNSEIIERARTQVGNLAHALKTPLSVLTNEARATTGPLAARLAAQTQLMRDQVNYYLERARRAAKAHGLGAVTEVEPVIEALVRTLQNIYWAKGVRIEAACDKGLKFRGEKQDLEEMVGNLLDNACKWGNRRIKVTARHVTEITFIGRSWLTVTVEDDGPGLPPEKRAEALQRGRRLDESKPGSGLGLSIVADMAVMYHGAVGLGEASLGGLKVTLKLPSAS
jgi:signal transduction histidine kinase